MGYMSSTTSQKKAKDFAVFALLLSILVFVVALGYHVIAGIQFNRDYKGHLKRAADANSIQMAEKELALCLRYLDDRSLDTESGRNRGRIDDHTSILYSTPDQQISFHYDNISASLNELRAVMAKGEGASALERSNVLIKLRESLIDHSGDGVHVTYPAGLDVYPDNTTLAVALVISAIVATVAAAYLKAVDE
jgi:hypothetical protein